MRRALALSWAIGTSTGVLLGLSGVQLVTSGITGVRIAPLSRPEVLRALSAGSASEAPEAPVARAVTVPPASPDIGSEPPLPDPVSKPAPTPPASAPPRPGATAGPTTTTTTPPPAPPPPPPPAAVSPPPTSPPATQPAPAPTESPGNGKKKKEPSTTTTTAPQKAETRTIVSRGGAVAVRYEAGKVKLLWARPNHDYDVVVLDDGPDQVVVRFRSDRARSKVTAYYKDGQPAQEVVERGGGGTVESKDVSYDGDGNWSWRDWDGWNSRDGDGGRR